MTSKNHLKIDTEKVSKIMQKNSKNGARMHPKTDQKSIKNTCQKNIEKYVKKRRGETLKIVLPPRRRASFAKSADRGKRPEKYQKIMQK